MPRKNVVLIRHGDCIMEHYDQDCDLSELGRKQMHGIGCKVQQLLRPNFLILESPLKRSTQSTDCILNKLPHSDYTRNQDIRLVSNHTYEPVISEIEQHSGDVLIVTHTPLLKNIYEEVMSSEYPFGYLPQGTIMRFQSVIDDINIKSKYAFLGIS